MPKRRTTPTDQTHIEGTETEVVELTPEQKRRLHRYGNDYADKLAQMQAWDAARKNVKPKVDTMMEELGLKQYVLPSGHTLKFKKSGTLSVTFKKDDDGKMEEVEMRRAEVE